MGPTACRDSTHLQLLLDGVTLARTEYGMGEEGTALPTFHTPLPPDEELGFRGAWEQMERNAVHPRSGGGLRISHLLESNERFFHIRGADTNPPTLVEIINKTLQDEQTPKFTLNGAVRTKSTCIPSVISLFDSSQPLD